MAFIMALNFFFMIFALVAFVSSLMVVTARHPVRAVLSLVLCFVAMAGAWMLLQAEFLSLVLVVVYVGAVMVLFLFVVMMLDVDQAERKRGWVAYWPLVLMLVVVMFVLLLQFLHALVLAKPTNTWDLTGSNIQQVGLNLFTYQLYPFELAALILLAAMVAAIALTFRGKQKNDRAQVIARQVKVSPKDRLRLIDLPSDINKKQG